MKSLQVFALLFTDEGKPLANAKVRVEYFQLASNSWTALASGATDAQGNLSLKIALANNDTLAPNLRLCEDVKETRVLAQHVQLSYDARNQALICDFGHVEQLDDTAYSFTSVQTSSMPLILSGQSKRPNITTAVLMRTLASTAAPSITTRNISTVDAAIAATQVKQPVNTQTIAQATNQTIAQATTATQPALSISADVFNAELIRFKALETDLQLQISAKDRELSTIKAETQNLKLETQSLKAALERAQQAEAKLKQENEQFVAESQRLSPIQNIAANIGAQVAAANQQLRSEQQPYQIQNIQIELRGTLSPDGQAINLLKMAELKEGIANASLVKMDLVTTQKPVAQEPTSTVPDVTGFTESVARRLLKSVGLKMEMVNRPVGANSQYVIGQAITQSPAAGTQIKHSEPVYVVFAVE